MKKDGVLSCWNDRGAGSGGFFDLSLPFPPFFHSEPLFLKLRWKRTLSWGTWKDSRLLSERWCTGRLSTLVSKGETGRIWFGVGGGGNLSLSSLRSFFLLASFGQGHRSSVSICSSVWRTLAILFSGGPPPFKPLLRRFLRRSPLGRDETVKKSKRPLGVGCLEKLTSWGEGLGGPRWASHSGRVPPVSGEGFVSRLFASFSVGKLVKDIVRWGVWLGRHIC